LQGYQSEDADLAITINRSDLEKTMMGVVSLDEQIASGKAKIEGDRNALEQMKTMLIHFDIGFELMPGTGDKDLTPEKKPFEQEDPAVPGGC